MKKILLIAMPSVHVEKWISQIDTNQFKLYWFDILNRGGMHSNKLTNKYINWKRRKLKPFKGEYFFSKKAPKLYEKVQPFLEVTPNEKLNEIIKELQPDIIHSFEMQSCSYPIIKTMNKFKNIKWVYSCWGNDFFYYKEIFSHLKKIKKVLARTNYLVTDCERDYKIAKQLGFKNVFLGVIPGGGGIDLESFKKYSLPIQSRNIILIKGYENKFGRALNVLKALQKINVNNYKVIVFGAHKSVINYIENNKLPYSYYGRHDLKHNELMKLMGQSLIYVGNSISDGMPNTVLEAIAMNVFPIQSNPGNATSEIITHGKNGFLIQNPNDIDEILSLIKKVLNNNELIKKAKTLNQFIFEERLDVKKVRQKISELYSSI